jgi:hypothetical protein
MAQARSARGSPPAICPGTVSLLHAILPARLIAAARHDALPAFLRILACETKRLV